MLLKKWLIADKNNDGKVDFEEFRTIIKNFNIRSKKSDLKRSFNVRAIIATNFKQFDLDHSSAIEFQEFVTFFQGLLRREEVEVIFRKYANPSSMTMDTFQLMKFLCTEQRETFISYEECDSFLMKLSRIYDSSQHRLENCSENGTPTSPKEPLSRSFLLNEYLFTRYLFSDMNSLIDPSIYKLR